MFEFTTLSVYNDIIIATPDEIKSGEALKGYNVIDNSEGTYKPYVRVGNTRFNKGQIVKFDVRNPSAELLAEVLFDLSKVADMIPEDVNEVTGRIGLYIGLSMNSLDSFYANDFVYKGKPFFIEFPVKKDLTDIAVSVKKIIDKYMLLMTDEKILNVIADGDNITIKGVNGYQLIRKAVLQWYNPESKSVDCCTNQGDYETIITGVPVMWTISGNTLSTENKVYDGGEGRSLAEDEVGIKPGLEAFGDYNWIIHNLRLPTLANTQFWSPTKNEMPIPGLTYVLITITMRDTNKGTAGNDIGQVTTCQTTHVLYVASNSEGLTDLIDLLTTLSSEDYVVEEGKITIADTKFNSPFTTTPNTTPGGNDSGGSNNPNH